MLTDTRSAECPGIMHCAAASFRTVLWVRTWRAGTVASRETVCSCRTRACANGAGCHACFEAIANVGSWGTVCRFVALFILGAAFMADLLNSEHNWLLLLPIYYITRVDVD